LQCGAVHDVQLLPQPGFVEHQVTAAVDLKLTESPRCQEVMMGMKVQSQQHLAAPANVLSTMMHCNTHPSKMLDQSVLQQFAALLLQMPLIKHSNGHTHSPVSLPGTGST